MLLRDAEPGTRLLDRVGEVWVRVVGGAKVQGNDMVHAERFFDAFEEASGPFDVLPDIDAEAYMEGRRCSE